MIGTPVLYYRDQMDARNAKPLAGFITGECPPGRWNLTYFGRPGFPEPEVAQAQSIPVFDAKPRGENRPSEFAVFVRCPKDSGNPVMGRLATKQLTP